MRVGDVYYISLTDLAKYKNQNNPADVLNVALFGMTAKEWRNINPNLNGNIRDYTDILHLVVLSNLEVLNSEMIESGIKQLSILYDDNNIKNIENIDKMLIENK